MVQSRPYIEPRELKTGSAHFTTGPVTLHCGKYGCKNPTSFHRSLIYISVIRRSCCLLLGSTWEIQWILGYNLSLDGHKRTGTKQCLMGLNFEILQLVAGFYNTSFFYPLISFITSFSLLCYILFMFFLFGKQKERYFYDNSCLKNNWWFQNRSSYSISVPKYFIVCFQIEFIERERKGETKWNPQNILL